MARRFLRLVLLAAVITFLWWIAPEAPRVGTHGGDGYRWDFHPTAHAQTVFQPPRSQAAAVFPTSVTSPSFILSDSSGSNTWTNTGGNHTANRTMTWIAGTDSSMALDSGRLSFGQALKVGPIADGWTTEAGSIAVEFAAKNTAADVEVHAEGGLTTGYAGFGVRNNRLVDGSGLTLAGGAWLANGATSASTRFGSSTADTVNFTNFGANSAGLFIGTDTQDPLVLGITTSTGSEPRYYFEDSCFSLTDAAAAATFALVSVPSNSLSGGTIDFVVWALTGANWQARSGSVPWSAINVAATETCTIGTETSALATTGGGTLANTWTCADGGTNTIALQISANSSFTTPTMAICYSIYKGAGVGGVTPQ